MGSGDRSQWPSCSEWEGVLGSLAVGTNEGKACPARWLGALQGPEFSKRQGNKGQEAEMGRREAADMKSVLRYVGGGQWAQ